MRKIILSITLFCFLITGAGIPVARAEALFLPAPGQMIALSQSFNAPILKGIKVYKANALRFDFILDEGDVHEAGASYPEALQDDSSRLIKYFLAALTVPEKDMWVNLSPYEKDRIVPEAFGNTEMGRDLLAQDYILKQITSSMIDPDKQIGKDFWKQVYAKAYERYGTTDIDIDAFNKVWIIPEKAVIYENEASSTAYVVESRLKVMLDSDHAAMDQVSRGELAARAHDMDAQDLAKNIMRQVILPALEKEVNEGKNFSRLRQVYSSFILAKWYKKKIRDGILARVYADQNKTAGIDYSQVEGGVAAIYAQYVDAFKKGAYNMIREEYDPVSQETIPRQYFSGGVVFDNAQIVTTNTLPAINISRLKAVELSLGPAQPVNNYIGRILNSSLHLPIATQNVLYKLRVFSNKAFIEHLGWGKNTENALAKLAGEYVLPDGLKEGTRLKVKPYATVDEGRPHVVLIGTFVEGMDEEVVAFFYLKIYEKVPGMMGAHRDGFFVDQAKPKYKKMAHAFRSFLEKCVYPSITQKVVQETMRTKFLGRYVYAKLEHGEYDFSDEESNFGRDMHGSVFVSVLELARKNLERFLARYSLRVEDLMLNGRLISSVEELTRPIHFALLRHKDGLKITLQPLIGDGFLGEPAAMDVGKAFMVADYEDVSQGAISVGDNTYSAEAMPSWIGARVPRYDRAQNMAQADEDVLEEDPLDAVRPADDALPVEGNKGGIDLNAAKMNFDIQSQGQDIQLDIDPEQLKRMQNAPGLVPTIIRIMPLNNLSQFLGANSKLPYQALASVF